MYLARGGDSNYVMRSTDGGATQALLSTYKARFLAASSGDRLFAGGFERP